LLLANGGRKCCRGRDRRAGRLQQGA
jgi:hypothetical protein